MIHCCDAKKKLGKAETGGRRRCAHLHICLQVFVHVWRFVYVFADWWILLFADCFVYLHVSVTHLRVLLFCRFAGRIGDPWLKMQLCGSPTTFVGDLALEMEQNLL